MDVKGFITLALVWPALQNEKVERVLLKSEKG
jgi:hypothetical protein